MADEVLRSAEEHLEEGQGGGSSLRGGENIVTAPHLPACKLEHNVSISRMLFEHC